MKPERLQPKENEKAARESRQAAIAVSITNDIAASTHAERMSMLQSIEDALSPLMKRAVEIKLEREREDMEALAENAAKLQAERARREGVLDSRFFRKRML